MEIIAHRGLHRSRAEENTIHAFARAVAFGCPMIELDVHRTSDGQLVVTHDPSLNFLGHQIIIADRTLENLIDSGFVVDRFYKENQKTQLPLPTLKLVLRLFLRKIKINVELKDAGSGLALGMTLKKLVNNSGSTFTVKDLGEVVVSSFRSRELETFRKLCRQIPTALLIDTWVPLRLIQDLLIKWTERHDINALHLSRRVATIPTIDYFKKRGVEIRVYTINDPNLLPFYIEQGVDGVFTDRAEEFLRQTGLLSQTTYSV